MSHSNVSTGAPIPGTTDQILDLLEAGTRLGYSADYLRTMMFRVAPDKRPPLYKIRGRWHAKLHELDAWAEANNIPTHPVGGAS